MTKIRLIKITGILGAFLAGGSLILSGHIEQGIGIISASLASASL